MAFHDFNKVIKQWCYIVGAWAGFGMSLKAKRWFIGAFNSLQRTIEERFMGNFQFVRKRISINCKTVVLTSYQNSAISKILHRMVCTMMSELHFDCVCSAGEG